MQSSHSYRSAMEKLLEFASLRSDTVAKWVGGGVSIGTVVIAICLYIAEYVISH